MLQKLELSQILRFVSKRWEDVASNPQSRVMQSLPDSFWMNSVGGRAGKGRWVATLMYTESQDDADAFKEVLLRWQNKGGKKTSDTSPDLIQIGRNKADNQPATETP